MSIEKPPAQSEQPKSLRSLLDRCAETDKSKLLKAFNATKKPMDEEEVLDLVWEEMIYDEKSTLWRLLKDRSLNPVNKAYPELSKKIQSGAVERIEDVDPAENSKEIWKMLTAYLEMRKQREEKRKSEAMERSKEKEAGFKTIRESFVKMDTEQEREDRELDAALASMILKARKINEGNNGVILKIDTGELDADAYRALEKAGLIRPEEDGGVIKILKLYHEGEGIEEMRNQKRAYDVLEEARRQGRKVARAPKVFNAREIDLPVTNLQERIKKALGVSSIGKRIGCLAMEYVKGEDLALRIWKEYVKAVLNDLRERRTGLKIDEELEGVDRMEAWGDIREYLEDLQKRHGREMKQQLDFLDHAPVTPEEELREVKINKRNADKMIQTLKRCEYHIDPRMYQEIEEAIEVLRENGIVYLDAHERNVMLTKDGVRLIDFGQCKRLDRPVKGDRDREAFTTLENPSGEPVDKRVLSFLRTLMPEKED